MKLANWTFPSLVRSHDFQKRDEFIHDSLASSFVLSKNFKNWSGDYDAESRLCVMNFHKEWKNPHCPTMKWYGLQTCRRFKSIQLWRNLDNQFFHEFLLILLTDGSACKVERMGEGSRTDAIRHIGCAAFDLIQRFLPRDYAAKKWSQGSQEMIIQVDFPRHFDLLDVLAICYTIQHKSPRASVYTLQRFNCYFLCNTILVVLTRRVAEWETLITDVEWPSLVDNMVDELKRKSLLPVKQQKARDFLGIGICALLYPDSTDPAAFLLEPFQMSLKHRGRDNVNKNLADTLWYQFVETAIDWGMFPYYRHVVDTVLDHPDPDSAAFKLYTLLKVVDPTHFPLAGLDLPFAKNTMSKVFLDICSHLAKAFVTHFKWELQMHALEDKPPLSQRLFGALAGLLVATAPTRMLTSKINCNQADRFARFARRFDVTIGQVASAIPLMAKLDFGKFIAMAPDEMKDNDFDANQRKDDLETFLVDNASEHVFPVVLSVLEPDSDVPNAPATLAFLNNFFPQAFWRECFEACMTRARKHEFRFLLDRKTSTLSIRWMDGNQEVKSVSTVAEFQARIRQRIQRHAERVQSFQLAAAPLVQQDLERSMTEVWKSLPSGFGARMVVEPRDIQESPIVQQERAPTLLTIIGAFFPR